MRSTTATTGRRTAAVGRADSAIGPLLVAVCDGKIVAIKFMRDAARFDDAMADLRREAGAAFDIVDDDAAVRPLIDQVVAYIDGRRSAIDAEFELAWATPFQRDVLLATARIPRGQVVSYREIARRVGRPNAYRAVGNTMHTNPIPILIPCHRVVGSDGGLTGFGGGIETKRYLLELEGAIEPATA